MSEPVRIVSHDVLEPGPTTPGMARHTAVATDTVWVGEVVTDAHVHSGWHHHGEHMTYGRVIDGSLEFEYGPNGGLTAMATAGDFFIVPAHTVHREGNPGDQQHTVVVIRVGHGPTVINVDGPDSA
jgi:uncharacterized RmlC-like cupin family protein